MKTTVCELPNDFPIFENKWDELISQVKKEGSELVPLPEMTISPWLAHACQAATEDNHLQEAKFLYYQFPLKA